jgi:hypothetical protein
MNSSGFCTSSSTLLENPLHDGRAYAELSANLAVRPESPKLAPMASPTF